MKNRVPRKKKKIAKKRKSINDSVLMAQSAMVVMSGLTQTAIIAAMPTGYVPIVTPAIKALKVAEAMLNTANAIKNITNQFKPWTHFVPNYRTL